MSSSAPPKKKNKSVQQTLSCFVKAAKPIEPISSATPEFGPCGDDLVASRTIDSAVAEDARLSEKSDDESDHEERTSVVATPEPPTLPETPYQPDEKFNFPKTKTLKFVKDKSGKHVKNPKTGQYETFSESRSCHSQWFKKWEWLHYDTQSDSLFCHPCAFATYNKSLIAKPNGTKTFVNLGYKNFAQPAKGMNKHQKSKAHKIASEKLMNIQTIAPIEETLSAVNDENQTKATKYLGVLFSSIKFLTQQGFPLRGHENRDGALYNLMKERIEHDNPDLVHLLNARDNWLSPNIQNEIIEIFSRGVQLQINEEIHESEWVGVVADGTTDCAGKEQFSVCVQYVKKDKLETENAFMGLSSAPDSTGATLGKLIKDVLLRNNIDLKDKLNGFAFDGASNMSGVNKGAQASLKADAPNALHVHCANHALDLGLQEAASHHSGVADALQFVKDASNVIRESSKRRQMFLANDEDALMLVAICPTRWCVRAKAMDRVIANYQTVLDTLKDIENDPGARGEARAKAKGLLKQGLKKETYFYLLAGHSMFSECEIVAKKLQSKHITAMAASELIETLKLRLKQLRTQDNFNTVMEKTNSAVAKYDLQHREERVKATPARIRNDGKKKTDERLATDQKWRRGYFEVLDLLDHDLERRFNQPDLKVAATREILLLQSSLSDDDEEEYSELFTAAKLPTSFSKAKLKRQIMQLRDFAKFKKADAKTVKDLTNLLCDMGQLNRSLYSEVERLMVLILCQPISVASAERSFSSLRRLKTWLRSTMSQSRLSHLALLSIHRIRVNNLNFINLVNQFIEKTPERRSVFGSRKIRN